MVEKGATNGNYLPCQHPIQSYFPPLVGFFLFLLTFNNMLLPDFLLVKMDIVDISHHLTEQDDVLDQSATLES